MHGEATGKKHKVKRSKWSYLLDITIYQIKFRQKLSRNFIPRYVGKVSIVVVVAINQKRKNEIKFGLRYPKIWASNL